MSNRIPKTDKGMSRFWALQDILAVIERAGIEP